MRFLEGVEENFRFMVLEVTKQVENTLKVLENPDPGLVTKIESRDDYIDNLKSVIENKCFSRIHTGFGGDKRAIDMARAVNIITSNLERLADHAVNIVMQSQYLRDPAFIKRYDYKAFFAEIIKALRLVVKALFNQDITLAFKICRAEVTLDALFKENFDMVLRDLRTGESPENCITAHNIFRYLERMGDTILNIGEAVIFAAVGEKFKIHQFEALKESLSGLGRDVPITDGEFQSIWGTRSGCRIGRVDAGRKGPRSSGVLFKEGNAVKLRAEAENIRRWEAVMPGLPPKVQAFHVDGDSASMLMEYLGGCTYQEVVLSGAPEIAANATFVLEQTTRQLWQDTRRPGPVKAGYVRQLSSRLDDVFRMHPGFRRGEMRLAGRRIPGFDEVLRRAEEAETSLEAPFSVLIHGDFNSNNIVYSHDEERIHYIDLHRSRDTDYVQDVSVFLLSNFRLPVLDTLLRARLDRVIRQFLAFSREFAVEAGDASFEARLALGLARSFITSSRFEFNQGFAREMFLRGVYLLESAADFGDSGKPWSAYVLPDAVLIY
ncbi:Phosphate-specific transport system accessory protein PhoU [Fundidesulfovibrio magnetotacticus]|uniref:Phosphate-specific transport system accessory protein PhoU n=1 Tax=Fundidesulfovibrio magnetotacticus TaxID=2730080 RepID=A0A6V8LTC4_9BACT|nr:PhoU domain-containing protein [Fundidesulfovibrio magnetotacticus]GFK95722.1 Phosphate-specific transport system accessory protein PhoU [Fundidesulfovibrio magnetotacticus]